jgi:translation initiation factor 4A
MLAILRSRGGSESEELFTPYDEVCESFEAMGLRDNLLRGIYAYGMCA